MKAKKLIRLLIFSLILLFESAVGLFAQYPTVYFNKLFSATGSGYTTSSNSITVGTQTIGQNFRFVGAISGSTYTGNGNNVDGSIVYTNAAGSLITLANGKISSVGPSSGGIRKYFNFFISASEVYILVNPKYDADVPGSASYQFNASSPITELNSFVTGQTTVTTVANLSGFTSCYGSASNAQTFTISGSNLSSNISVTAPTGFEVSLSAASGYSSSISLTKGSGTSINTTTVYVRMLASNAAGSYSGNIVASATNCANQNVYAFGDVFTAPAITTQPSNATVCTGIAGTFSLVATGGNLTYQWQVNAGSGWTNLSDAGIYYGTTTSVLRFSNAVNVSYSTYQYRCVVSGACTPAVTSNTATLTVNAAVNILTQPINSTVCSGSASSFSVSATGAGISYQWQVYSSGVWSNATNSVIYSGATTNTLSLSSTSSSQNGLEYKCILTGTCTSQTSSAATLVVNVVPAAPSSISGDATICQNTIQSYSATSVSGATSYTWTIPLNWVGTSTLSAINITANTLGGEVTVKANNSCGSSSTTNLNVTVSNNPAPVVNFEINTATQCLSGNSFAFTNSTTNSSGVTITSNNWNFGDGNTDGNSNPTHVFASANTYNVNLRVIASNGCISSKSRFVTVNPAPTSNISGTQSICAASTAALSVNFTGSQPWSITYSDGSTPTTVNSISSSLYTLNVAPSTSKTYTISSITDANCSTNSLVNRTGSAIITVNPNLTASVSITSNDADNSVCSGASVTFTATPTNGGSPAYLWQKNGVDLSSTSSSYTVNSSSLLDNDAFSVRMTSSATCTINNVVFSNNISLNIAPAAPRTPTAISGSTIQCALGVNKSYSIVDVLNATSYVWSAPSGWTISSGQGSINAFLTVGAANQIGDISVYASNGCGSSTPNTISITAVNASPSAPTGSASQAFCSAISPTVASLVATGTSINWYDSALLTSVLISSTSLSSSANYYATQTSGGCESPSFIVASTVYTNPTITTTTVGNTCGTGTVTLSASPSSGTISWFAGNSGGSSLGSLTSFTTPSISTTTTYYVQATSNGCNSISRSAVIATVNAIPTIATTTPASICGSGIANIAATASVGNINWYDSNSGGVLLISNSTSYTSPTITVTTTYYAEANNNGCISAARSAIAATIISLPTISTNTPASRCGTGALTLGATGSAGVINWFSTNISGSSLATGTSYTTSSLSVTTTFYVQAENLGCVSALRTSIVATIKPVPTLSANAASRCGNGVAILSATPSAGSLNWYDVSSAGISLASTNSFTTPILSSSTIYYVDATLNGCSSARTAVTATVTQVPISISGSTTNYDQVDLVASGGISYTWSAGNSLNTAANTFDESGTYTVTVTDISGCISTQSVSVLIKIKGLNRFGNTSEEVLQVSRFGRIAGNSPILKTGAQKKFQKFKIISQNLAVFLNPTDLLSYSGSGITWSDLSSNTNHGSLQNGLAFQRQNGGIFTFDGLNDYVSFSAGLGVTTTLTIDAWINTANLTGQKTILSQNGNSAGSFQFQLNGQNIQFILNGEQTMTAVYSVNANQWVNLVVVFNRTDKTLKFYINGSLVNSETYSSPPSITNTTFNVGSYEGYTRFFTGSIGIIKVYQTALNNTEIDANYQANKDIYGY